MIRENVQKIRQRILSALSRSGRQGQDLTLVAVSKGRTVEEILKAAEAGISDLGENRIQEALGKYGRVPNVRWHMVGHLQSNKAKDAVRMFGLIHSVDSLHLAAELDKQASRINKVQPVLLEVNISGEAAKFGIKPEEAPALAAGIRDLKNLELRGLMTVAPVAENPETVRPVFKGLRELKERINRSGNAGRELTVLSMGMTDDFEVAIEEGSTMVRIGRAVFEG
jgi:PLP dependent protein